MLNAPFDTEVFPPAPFVATQAVIPPQSESSTSSLSAAGPPAAATISANGDQGVLDLFSRFTGGAPVRAVCINLDRRPDRWEQFCRACPILGIQRFAAVDGRKVRPPEWWRQGGGAWGCMLSHVRTLEHALTDDLDRAGGVLLVLEDDALFPPDFAERTQRFVQALPTDWDQIYFGGQHRGLRGHPPKRVNDEVIRPHMVNRTQAYAVRGAFIRTLYRHLCDWPEHSRHPRHHVDHRMELLHASGRYNIYAPTRWIIGQAGGKSDISGRTSQDRFWNYHVIDGDAGNADLRADASFIRSADGTNKPRVRRMSRRAQRRLRIRAAVRKPPVWVIGLHRSGSSVTAGILHRLGVHMGNRLIGYENRGTGGFEARGLAHICEEAYPFPSIEPKVTREVTKNKLRRWLNARMGEAAHRGTIAGGKYPHLCFLVDMLLELEPESRFIHIDRPLEDSIRSLTDRSAKVRGWLRASPEQSERLQRALDDAKRVALAKISSGQMLTIPYHDLLAEPASHVDRIVRFLDLRVGPQQLRAANALVEPSRRRF